MLKINKKLSKKGFSLIELMVAVVILALAIFGIFHAYSVGFMGMADARDRTVASNYMREIMEDIKNTDFEKIEEKAGTGVVTISGKTFTKVVTVEPSTNLKKVSTIIYWDNYTKSVKSDMLVHYIQTIAGDPSRIMLFANPYKITPNSNSELTAIVKDEKGNNVKNWTGYITFSITSTPGLGYLNQSPGTTTIAIRTENGQASVIYTAPDSEGDATIEASAYNLISDSITITVTSGAVKIALSATDTVISPGKDTIITAKLVNANNDIPDNVTDVDITFSVSSLGSIASPTTRTTSNGSVNINLSTSLNPGTITVTASYPELDPGTINIITGGNIDITSTSNSIPIGESVDMTVTVKDLNGIPINYKGIIDLSSSGSEGVLGSFPNNPENQIVYDGTTSSNVVSYAVNNSSSTGTVTITASEPDGILNSGTISYEIGEKLIPDHIMVYANPANIKADGSTSIITATVKTYNNRTVESYSHGIKFEILNTELGYIDPTPVTPNNGIAKNELISYNNTGVATINVSSTDIDNNNNIIKGFTTVGFYLYADNVDLVASPPSILKGGGLDGTTKITATIKDGEATVSGYTGSVTFSILEGHPYGVVFTTTNKSSVIVPVGEDGEATVYLESKNWTGTAKIKAVASDGISINLINYIYIPVLSSAELNLVEGTIGYDSTYNWVSFDIEVLGADINLEEMQYSWLSSPSPIVILNNITIDDTSVFSGTVGSDTIITIIGGSFILSPGTHTIVLDFSDNVSLSGEHIEVIFNPDSGNYPVDFTIPTT